MDYGSVKKSMADYWERFFDHVEAMANARKKYMKQGIVPDPQIISPSIVESWRRSFSYGLDTANIIPEFLSKDEFEETIRENQGLIHAATPILSNFAQQFSASLFTVDLYDKNLCLIKCYGKSSDLLERGEYVRPGLIRTEAACGTTSMSQAFHEKEALQIIGAEHFSDALQEFVCTAAPIMFKNECIGLINVVEHQWEMSNRTLGTLVALSKSVEYNYEQQQLTKELTVASSLNESIIKSIADGIILVGSHGRITKVNVAASDLLGIEKSKLENADVVDVFGPNNPFSSSLNLQITIKDQEISLNVRGQMKRFIGSIEPIFIHGVMTNLMISIKSLKSTQSIIKQAGGWNATYTFENIIGNNPIFRQAITLAEQTASLDSNTLIQGESGTGKELFAHAIHNASAFASGPFVVINCSAIPVGLLESELFGYESGAYTGAKKNGQPGKFEMADGGTVFLDEINSVPLDIQVKLLRVLQDKRITRIGGNNNLHLHVKIVAACNVNLWDMVQRGLFRSDLFYRLNVITIHIPPLCQHADDIPLIADSIIKRLTKSFEIDLFIAKDAMEMLMGYSWLGNVRELENVLERSFVNASLRNSKMIDVQDLNSMTEFSGMEEGQFASRAASGMLYPASGEKTVRMKSHLLESEKAMIQSCLSGHGGNISATARELGMARNTLYQRIKDYGL